MEGTYLPCRIRLPGHPCTNAPLDPDSNAYAFLHTASALNIAKHSNLNADTLLGQARAEGDPATRRTLYGQLWRQV